MNNREKLEKLNALDVVDCDGDGAEMNYVVIENNLYNIQVLRSIGATDEDIEKMECNNGYELDITAFAFANLDAEWFDPKIGFY